MGLRKIIGAIFKAFFGLISVIGLLLIISVIWITEADFGGGVSLLLAPGVLIPAALIIWLLVRKRAVPSGHESPQPSGLVSMDQQTSGTVFRGLGATIELLADSLSITREGTVSVILHGLAGEKRIAYGSITATQLRGATPIMSGFLQFTVLGGIESNRGIWDATMDENTVMFTHQQEASFRQLREVIERKMVEVRQPSSTLAASSVADELAKLFELKSKGALSDEEFGAQKAILLR
ncbi:SHOCT domain-containing protein [Novosphingobium aquae]|uniref:SHOCT domain-containing protein n=1 Tax=Novosphingobium aquae TaxID=3133435 RepID=A0ABU8SE29_9SPHN